MFMGVFDALNASLDNIIFPMKQEEILRTKEDFLRVAKLPQRSWCHWWNPDSHHRNVWRWWACFSVQERVSCHKHELGNRDRWLANSSIPEIMDQLPGGGWLLGDSGYPFRPWLMTPFLTPQAGQQEKYNASHIKTRNCVERAFGVLGNTSLLSSLYFFNLSFSRDCTSNWTTTLLPHLMMMS